MSSSDAAGDGGAGSVPAPARRRLLPPFLVAGFIPAVLALAGCGLHPVYGPGGQAAVVPELAAIEVAEMGNSRRSQEFRNALLNQLNPSGLEAAPQYRLTVRLDEEQTRLAIQLNDVATRYNLTLAANFTLTRNTDGQPLYSSAVRRVASYNVRSEPFANRVSEQDAQLRAGEEVARQIRTMLALYFADRRKTS
jgi:LPS-assembly lipoprotein